MNDNYLDALTEIAEAWDIIQLDKYIMQREQWAETNKTILKVIRRIRRGKIKKIPLNTGTRGGK